MSAVIFIFFCYLCTCYCTRLYELKSNVFTIAMKTLFLDNRSSLSRQEKILIPKSSSYPNLFTFVASYRFIGLECQRMLFII